MTVSSPKTAKNKTRPVIIGVIILTAIIAGIILNAGNNRQAALSDKSVPVDSTDEYWYKNAVIYTLDVEVFKDSDGDGVGDFKGLIDRLGYIDSLGVDVVWLAPFQPTPNKDDGYDVSDFYGIDRRLGSFEDFNAFIQKAKQYGLRVIMDLVLNHTSDEHPWFKNARTNAHSPYRSWYVWSKNRPQNYDVGMVFPGVQQEIWSYDSSAREYYYHRFYKFQPDLNAQNPAVEAEVQRIIKYWIDLGLDGFRLDAVPFYIEVAQTKGEEFERRFDMLTKVRAYLQSLKKDAIILGEANVLPEEVEPYFGKNGDAMHMMFNFFVNQHLFYALATGEVKPLADALKATEDVPKAAQWGQFLRNHDELDLGRLGNKKRRQVYDAFGPEKDMQLYDRGIRRRLAPMMNNNLRQMELAYSVLFSLPSTPVMRYGDEIGMGDELTLKERESVRTPMQWTSTENGGFSTATRTVKPVIDTGTYGYKTVNVSAEKLRPNSLLNWTEKLVRLRKRCPEIGYGNRTILETGNDHLLAIRYNWQGKSLVIVHNFSDKNQRLKLSSIPAASDVLENIFSSDKTATAGHDDGEIVLQAYGYIWYRVAAR